MLKKIIFVGMLCATSLGFAEDSPVHLMGTVTHTLHTSNTVRTLSLRAAPQRSEKIIALMAIKLDASGQQVLLSRPFARDDSASALPSSKQLGMNGVPVLDQGRHGTCVTFAVTAAYDAVLGKDYISQLCQLMLGSYLSTVDYQHSGWDGAWGHAILSQMDMFGIVSKKKQQDGMCGSMVDYPLYDASTPAAQMTLPDFYAVSENLAKKTRGWYSLLKVTEAFNPNLNMQSVLNRVKSAIDEGDRVVFGSLLVDVELGNAGALGRHHATSDTWVLTQQIKQDLETATDFNGHEMVITGYDDNAVAIDPDGVAHTGLLTIRNSWGKDIADKGDFYMSYEYFKTLALEAHRIRSRVS